MIVKDNVGVRSLRKQSLGHSAGLHSRRQGIAAPHLAQQIYIRWRAAAERRQLVGEECCRVGEVLRQSVMHQSPQPALGTQPGGGC